MTVETVVVRASAARRRVEEWALVLEAEGIPGRVVRSAEGWDLAVPPPFEAAAEAALAAYEAESLPVRSVEPEPPPRDHGPSTAGLLAAALVAVLFRLSGPRVERSVWFDVGTLTPRAVTDEPWRLVTALTLHADVAHVVSNAATGAVLITLLARALGPGLAAWVLLAAGAGGNALSASLHGPGYAAIGASTAVLGAVGALAGIGMRWRPQWRSAWIPLAAGLGLLAMLGSAEGTDLGAHASGFVVGIPLGALAARWHLPVARGIESLVAVLAMGVVVAAWVVGFASVPG